MECPLRVVGSAALPLVWLVQTFDLCDLVSHEELALIERLARNRVVSAHMINDHNYTASWMKCLHTSLTCP
jgi:hypothetical protein